MPERPERRYFPGVLVGILAGLAFVVTTLNCVYDTGLTLWDSGIFETTIWRTGWTLQEGRATGGLSFFRRHVSPTQWLPNLISYAYPWDRISYFALVYGLLYAQLVFVAYLLFVPLFEGRGRHWWAALAAVALFLSQAVVQGAWEPHMEIAVPLFAALAFRAWQLRSYREAGLWFLANAGLREDLGTMFAIPLGLLVVAQVLELRKVDPALAKERFRWGVALVAGSVLFSTLAVFIQRTWFGGEDIFHNLYFDEVHPFSHLSAELLARRAHTVLVERPGIYLPLLALAIGAVALRDFQPLIGAISFLPYWGAMFLSKHDMSAELGSYKPFPFIFSMMWPAVIALVRPAQRKRYLALQLVVLACGLGHVRRYTPRELGARWIPGPYTYSGRSYQEFGAHGLPEEHPESRRTKYTQSIGALYPYQVIDWWHGCLEDVKPDDLDGVDTFLWFQGEREQPHVDEILATGRFTVLEVPDTRIRIAHKTPR